MSGSYVTRFFFNDTASTEIYTYCHAPPLHVALPIYLVLFVVVAALAAIGVHVDPARPFHLAHMIDQILRVVSHIAALRLVAVFQPRLAPRGLGDALRLRRSEEHPSELQSLMRISYAVFCLKKKNTYKHRLDTTHQHR